MIIREEIAIDPAVIAHMRNEVHAVVAIHAAAFLLGISLIPLHGNALKITSAVQAKSSMPIHSLTHAVDQRDVGMALVLPG